MKRVSKQISHRLYTIFVVWAMAGLCLVSCSDETRPEGVETGGADEEVVTLSLPVVLPGMENKSISSTTRAEVAKEAAEMKINKLYVLQFDGTADAAKLLKCVSLTAPTLDAEGSAKVSCQFKPATVGFAKQSIYMVANVDLSAYVGNTSLTKSAFLSLLVKFTPSATVPAAGLPMCGSNEFDPMMIKEEVPEFRLKAMVAKVTYTYSMNALLNNYLKGDFTLTLKQVANGASYKEPTDLSVAHTPTGLTRNTEVNLGKLTVSSSTTELTGKVYLPENIVGQTTGIAVDEDRSLDKAKAGATYLELKGKDVTGAKNVSFVLFLGDPANENDFNVKRNCAYTITDFIEGVSLEDSRVSMVADLSRKADGTAATANCYVISNSLSKDYTFDATKRGNNATGVAGINYATLPDLATATEARVLWQTGSTTSVVKSVALDKANGKVLFTTGTAPEGNAVIGLFASSAANAPCLWSWHIWKVKNATIGTVTGSKTSATTGGTVNVTMMDRNLGAYNNNEEDPNSVGLMYQWGRKDPFPGPEGFNTIEPTNIYGSWNDGGTTGSWTGAYSIKAAATSATVGTEAWAVKYPTAYIAGADWMFTKNDNLWGTPWTVVGTGGYNKNQGTKSIYDPCPMGYRVPPQDTWSKQTGDGSFGSNGIILGSFHSSLWFPAAGYRNFSNGSLSSARIGFYWSSSPYADGHVYAGILYFNNGGTVSPRASYGRALGFSVRCVSE